MLSIACRLYPEYEGVSVVAKVHRVRTFEMSTNLVGDYNPPTIYEYFHTWLKSQTCKFFYVYLAAKLCGNYALCMIDLGK